MPFGSRFWTVSIVVLLALAVFAASAATPAADLPILICLALAISLTLCWRLHEASNFDSVGTCLIAAPRRGPPLV